MIAIPTIKELFDSVLTDLKSELSINIPVFGKAVLIAFAAVQAAKLKLFYLAIATLQKNQWVDTAEPEEQGGNLERFGRVKLDRDRNAAVSAEYVVDVTGTIGATIDASQTFKSNDDSLNPGQLFVLDDAYTLTAVTDQITLRAIDGGLDSKLDVADKLTSTSPILNVDSEVTVDSVTVEPIDRETIEEYRSAIVEAFRLEPQGGAPSDYRIWASDVTGVRKVYPYATDATKNTVTVYVEINSGDGTAPALILDEVADVLEMDPDTTKPDNERGRRPLGILSIEVESITPETIDIEITGLANDTTSVRATIESALSAMLFEVRPFIAGADVLENQNDTITSSKIGFGIQSAIGNGNFFESVSFEVDSVAETSYTFLLGNIPKLGTITYV